MKRLRFGILCAVLVMTFAAHFALNSGAGVLPPMTASGSSPLLADGPEHSERPAILSTLQVIDSVPAPGNSHMDLAWDGSYLWLASNETTPIRIYKIDPSTGAAVDTLYTSLYSYVLGLTYLNGALWIQEWYNWGRTYQIDPSSGATLDSFQSPGGVWSRGLANDGEYLWIAFTGGYTNAGSLYQVDTFGGLWRTVDISSTIAWPMGITYVRATGLRQTQALLPSNMWVNDNSGENNLKELGVSGSPATLISEWDLPGNPPYETPEGLTNDGEFLWYTAYRASWIWKLAIPVPVPPDTAKMNAISHLQTARSLVPKPEQSKVSEAINFIQWSLNSGWWVDCWHLNENKEGPLALGESSPDRPASGLTLSASGFIAYPVPREQKRYGEYVFEKEVYAARIMRALLKNTWYNPHALEELKNAALDIMYADSSLAQIKIEQADSAGADPGEIRQARYAMQLAEALKRSGRQYYDVIVSYYGSAWLHAVKAQELGDFGPQMAWVRGEEPVFALGMPCPNPSYSGSVIAYSIGQPSNVGLNVYDISGRLIRTLVDEVKLPGSYAVQWDGRDASGSRVPSGTYIYRLGTGSFTANRKVIMVK